MPYGEEEAASRMRRILMIAACVIAFSWRVTAQESAPSASSAKSTTLVGCLAGPDTDDLYTLTSMQHRLGVEVVGGDELKQGAGAKVKLTGSWEALPGSEGKKGDAARRFKATAMTVMEDKCQAPAPVTPVSKKKQEQQEQQKQQKQESPTQPK
jgi:hypothetical protein